MLQAMARERMAAPFQGSSQSVSSAAQPDSQSVSSMQSHDQDSHTPVATHSPSQSPALPARDIAQPDVTDESSDDALLRAEASRLVSRVLAKAVAEVCLEPLDIQVNGENILRYTEVYIYLYPTQKTSSLHANIIPYHIR